MQVWSRLARAALHGRQPLANFPAPLGSAAAALPCLLWCHQCVPACGTLVQDKGADVVEGQKLYARIFRGLSTFGIRI